MKKKKMTLGSLVVIVILLVLYFVLPSPEPEQPSANNGITAQQPTDTQQPAPDQTDMEDLLAQLPEYSGEMFTVLNDNQPLFTEADYTTDSYETYEDLDGLGRCTYAMACLGEDLMPTQERENISQIRPTGWQFARYDFIEGESLYNRSHLIAFQLAGENANEKNLITGTRYMNAEGMEPFESMVGDYIRETGNHVLYRVIPVFTGDNLIADGVTMEAWSVEDDGEGICFFVYLYNVQPGVEIDYRTGDNWLAEPVAAEGETVEGFVANISSGKFHEQSCPQWESIQEENRKSFETTRSQMLAWNFVPAGCCNP